MPTSFAGGENVYSTEVEAVLSAHPEVQQAAVFGVPNAVMGEMVYAAVVLHTTSPPLMSQQLIKWCHASLAAYKCPTSIHFMLEMPLTGSGKVLKTALKAALASGTLAVATASKPALPANATAGSTVAAVPAAAHYATVQTPRHTAAAAAQPPVIVQTDMQTDAEGQQHGQQADAPRLGDNEEVQMQQLVMQYAKTNQLIVQDASKPGSVLQLAKCHLLAVPDWTQFVAQASPSYLSNVATLSMCPPPVCATLQGLTESATLFYSCDHLHPG